MFKVLFAYDISGSTGSFTEYHNASQQIKRDLIADYGKENVAIAAWDSAWTSMSHEELDEVNATKKGRGGTSPIEIAKAFQAITSPGHLFGLPSTIPDAVRAALTVPSPASVLEELVILTDGEVSASSVGALDDFIQSQSLHFPHVRIYICNKGDTPNMSVCCPFMRNGTSQVFQWQTASGFEAQGSTAAVLQTEVTAEALALLRNLEQIRTADDFFKHYAELEAAVIAATMGVRMHEKYRYALILFRKRIVRELAEAELRSFAAAMGASAGESPASIPPTLQGRLEAGPAMLPHAIDAMKLMYPAPDAAVDTSFEGRVNHLIAMCEGSLAHSFVLTDVKSNRARRAVVNTSAEDLPAEGTDPGATAECPTVFCPILFDDTSDVVILLKRPDAPLLAHESLTTKDVDDMTNMPLNGLFKPEFFAALRGCIDSVVSLEAYRLGRFEQSPTTRAELVGAVALGAHPEHAKSTDWTLAKVLSGGRLLGNPDLWFALFRLAAQQVPFLSDVRSHVDAHMKWRLQHKQTYASLSGLSTFVCAPVPLGVACWHVVHSFLADPETRGKTDPFRTHLGVLDKLRDLYGLLDYPTHPQVPVHLARTRFLLSGLRASKASPSAFTAQSRRTQALVQAHLTLDVSAFSEEFVHRELCDAAQSYAVLLTDGPCAEPFSDGSASDKDKEYALSASEKVSLQRLINPNKSAKDIPLPHDWSPTPLAELVLPKQWTAPEAEDPVLAGVRVPICPHTMRPWTTVRSETGVESWKDASTRVFGPLEQQLNVTKLYASFVCKHLTFPTRDELIAYIWNRTVQFGPETKRKQTLPPTIVVMVDTEIAEHERVMRELAAKTSMTFTPQHFVALWQSTIDVSGRAAMEAKGEGKAN
jgi:hypothetical protein